MNNEIKEILGNLKYNIETNKNWTLTLGNSIDRWKLLLDYITNLQEKVNQYENPDDMTLFYMWLDEKAKDKIKQLQEKNKKLNNIMDKIRMCLLNYTREYCTDEVKSRKVRMINADRLENILNGGDE